MSITSSAASVCSEFGFRFGSSTWCRMAFEKFGHQAVDRTSCRTDDLQHLRAIAPLIQNPLKGLKLPPDALATQNQLLMLCPAKARIASSDSQNVTIKKCAVSPSMRRSVAIPDYRSTPGNKGAYATLVFSLPG